MIWKRPNSFEFENGGGGGPIYRIEIARKDFESVKNGPTFFLLSIENRNFPFSAIWYFCITSTRIDLNSKVFVKVVSRAAWLLYWRLQSVTFPGNSNSILTFRIQLTIFQNYNKWTAVEPNSKNELREMIEPTSEKSHIEWFCELLMFQEWNWTFRTLSSIHLVRNKVRTYVVCTYLCVL